MLPKREDTPYQNAYPYYPFAGSYKQESLTQVGRPDEKDATTTPQGYLEKLRLAYANYPPASAAAGASINFLYFPFFIYRLILSIYLSIFFNVLLKL